MYQTILSLDEFKKFVEDDIRHKMGIYFDFYMCDNRNEIWSFEIGKDRMRVVNDPYWDSQNRTGNLMKDIMWCIAWESDEESDQEINPWDLPSFPIIIYPTIDEVFKHNPLK